jgi:hypothetical protein
MKMDELETTLTLLWKDILIRTDVVSKVLQKYNINLSVTVRLTESSMGHASKKRDFSEQHECRRKGRSHIDDS